MRKLCLRLLITIIICLPYTTHSMEVSKATDLSQQNLFLISEVIVCLAAQSQPRGKNALMKVCKKYNACLKNRELILQANPFTVSNYDKIQAMFNYTCSGDAATLKIWLDYIKKAGIDVNTKNYLDMTSFHIASDNRNPKIMRLLKEYGADASILEPSIPALHKALFRRDLQTVNLLLECGADPNMAIINHKITPLHVIANIGFDEITQLFIDKGADVHATNTSDETPLCVAACYGKTNVAITLIKNGAHVEVPSVKMKITPVQLASQYNHIETTQMLIDSGADINRLRSDGVSPLANASYSGHVEMIILLLTNGAKKSINYPFTNQFYPLKANPLYIAAQKGHLKIVQILVAAGAYIPWKNDAGETALDVAEHTGHTDIVAFLLEYSAYNNNNQSKQKNNCIIS